MEGQCINKKVEPKKKRIHMKYFVLHHDVESVRELVVDEEFLSILVLYLVTHKNEYCWVIYRHQKTSFCPLMVPTDHNHIMLWYDASNSWKYFSNMPFVQFARRKSLESGRGFVKSYSISNVKSRM